MIQKLKKWVLCLCGIGGALFVFQQGTSMSPDYSKTPVLFIHGSGMYSSTWTKMIRYFVQTGYPAEYLHAVELKPNEGSNKRAVFMFIKPAVESLLQQAAVTARQAGFQGKTPQRVDLVSHSMGAASSRWYAAKLHPERVRTWISVAGSNHGTNALCAYVRGGEGNREMCPAFATSVEESAFQVMLNGTPQEPIDETPFGLGKDRDQVKRIPPDERRNILYYTIRIEPDGWIKPEHSALLDGAGGISISIPPDIPVRETSSGNYLFTKKVTHDPLPSEPDLMRFVALLLAVRDE
jgi:hypothetical protein